MFIFKEVIVMKISDHNPSINLEAYVKNVKNSKKSSKPAQENPVGVKDDKVILSSLAKEIGDIKKLVDSIPDINEKKIEEIKEKIKNGSYKIDSDKVAFKLIRESLLNNEF
jgi:negative regulator of flagellin synthesis FlgM